MLLEELFFEIGMVLVIAAGLSMLVYRLKQPLIIAYIITGILVGPGLFAVARSPEIFEVMSQIGVAFLLFTVGLGLNWRSVKDVGGIALATGVGQVIFTTVIGYVIAQLLGFDFMTSLFLAIAFTFSSTIIVIKLLMDKGDLDSLYGRISVGFLLVQDFIAMFILLWLGSVGSGMAPEDVVLGALIKSIIVIPVLYLVSTRVIPPLVAYAARSQELLFIFAVAWCFLIAGVLVAFGFGVELGALIAGITLSGTVFEREINARIRPLRDFFLIIFFILLGTQLTLGSLESMIVPTIIFSLFILIGNPIIVMLIMRALGYHPRTGFLAGTTVAQISEFSFIVIAAGIAAGQVGEESLALATGVGLVTIAASAYMIENNTWIYGKLAPVFKFLEPERVHSSKNQGKRKVSPKVVLFGFHRMGKVLLEPIRKMKKPYLIIDFDPHIVTELSELGEPNMYGDAGDENFLIEIQLEKTDMVISTIPDVAISLSLLTYLHSKSYKGVVIVASRNQKESEECYLAGATYVIVPSVLGGERFKELLQKKKSSKLSWKRLAGGQKESSS